MIPEEEFMAHMSKLDRYQTTTHSVAYDPKKNIVFLTNAQDTYYDQPFRSREDVQKLIDQLIEARNRFFSVMPTPPPSVPVDTFDYNPFAKEKQ